MPVIQALRGRGQEAHGFEASLNYIAKTLPLKNLKGGWRRAGEMTPRLRALSALPKDLEKLSSQHLKCFLCVYVGS